MKGFCISNLLLTSFVICYIACTDAQKNIIVKTKLGQIEGILENTAQPYLALLGVPFTQTSNRFEPATPIKAWEGVLNATTRKKACPQIWGPEYNSTYEGEDCLHVNIWAPVDANGAPYPAGSFPILIYIHGGGWETGDGALELYRGDFFANDTHSPIVVCTISYRLGALGFLVTQNISGNFGFSDQQLAMNYCGQQIGPDLGGDSKRITLQGQSAGAISVAIHMTTPTSFPLFQRAILESPTTILNLRTLEQSYYFGNEFCSHLGCDSSNFTCLQSKTVPEILAAQAKVLPKPSYPLLPYNVFIWMPVIDNVNIIGSPLDLINSNQINPNLAAVIWGNTKNETAAWILGPDPSLTLLPVEYDALIKLIFAGNASAVEKEYPAKRASETRDQLANLADDWMFTCSLRAACQSMSSNGWTVYRYLFFHPPSSDPRPNATVAWCTPYNLSCHGAEIDYIWKSAQWSGASFTANEVSLSNTIHQYILDFVNGQNLTSWNQYDPTIDNSFVFDLPNPYQLNQYHESYCEFWNSIDAYK